MATTKQDSAVGDCLAEAQAARGRGCHEPVNPPAPVSPSSPAAFFPVIWSLRPRRLQLLCRRAEWVVALARSECPFALVTLIRRVTGVVAQLTHQRIVPRSSQSTALAGSVGTK